MTIGKYQFFFQNAVLQFSPFNDFFTEGLKNLQNGIRISRELKLQLSKVSKY